MIRRPPRSPLFPYPTLFRSQKRPAHTLPAHPLLPSQHHPHHTPVTLCEQSEANSSRHIWRSEEHPSELQSPDHLVCPLLLAKKKTPHTRTTLTLPHPR